MGQTIWNVVAMSGGTYIGEFDPEPPEPGAVTTCTRGFTVALTATGQDAVYVHDVRLVVSEALAAHPKAGAYLDQLEREHRAKDAGVILP